MAKKREKQEETIGNYFLKEKPLEFISSGCEILNCVLGGGWPLGRIVNVVGDKAAGKCTKDAYILSNNGMHYLDSMLKDDKEGLSNRNQILTIDKNTTDLSTLSYKERVYKTYKITTRHGYEIECTSDHPILISDPNLSEEMVKAKNLNIGDVAIIASNTSTFGENKECNKELAFLLGCIVANGINPKYGSVRISTKKKYLKEKLEIIIKNLGYNPKIKEDLVEIYNKDFSIELWKKFFQEKEDFTARHKFVPKQILESPKDIQSSFLRGLLDCDGYYDQKKGRFEYYTSSETLSKQVHLMLLNFGIVANRQFIDQAIANNKIYNHKYWTISFGGKYLNTYNYLIGSDKYKIEMSITTDNSDFDVIPFLKEKMRNDISIVRKELGWTKNGRIRGNAVFPQFKFGAYKYATFKLLNNFIETFRSFICMDKYNDILLKKYHYDPISSIEEISYDKGEFVYDVYVPISHRFWCNGFISHNTMLAIEACANFVNQYPNGKVYYLEAEAAFDIGYAEALGMPIDVVNFIDDVGTIEGLFEVLSSVIELHKSNNEPALFIIDSLDALSDKAEKEREIDKGSYGAEKAKKLSELFRRVVKDIESTKLCLMAISQVRERIGIMFGEKYGRSGGKALDFYASQILWLSEINKIKKTVRGIERPIGLTIKALCKKNKVSFPYRSCELPLIFGFGIDDLTANLNFLREAKGLEEIGLSASSEKEVKKIVEELVGNREKKEEIKEHVKKIWKETETEFIPRERKYQNENV